MLCLPTLEGRRPLQIIGQDMVLSLKRFVSEKKEVETKKSLFFVFVLSMALLAPIQHGATRMFTLTEKPLRFFFALNKKY